MKRTLTINGKESAFELLSAAPECRYRVDEGPEREAQVEAPEPGVYSILMDGKSYDAFVTETTDGLAVSVNGWKFDVAVIDPRKWSRRGGAHQAGGVQTLISPMPGKVVRVLAGVGDVVEAGQGIVVVEAMKMQNELKAGRAGQVLSLPAAEGATVTAGQALATIG